MTALCHPLPATAAHDLLGLAAHAFCDRPGETREQSESRTRQMVHMTMGFEPRDGIEYMLATLVTGHFHLILDSIRDIFQGQLDTTKLRTKSGIVTLDRAMLSIIQALRRERERPLAGGIPREAAVEPEVEPQVEPQVEPEPARAAKTEPAAPPEAATPSAPPNVAPPALPATSIATLPLGLSRKTILRSGTAIARPTPGPELAHGEIGGSLKGRIAAFEHAMAGAKATLAESAVPIRRATAP